MTSQRFATVCAQASIVSLLLVDSAVASFITPINLNDFFKDSTVTVVADGSSATIAEDSTLTPVLLANDPGQGDANAIVPASGLRLAFDYSFVVPAPNNRDEFGAFVVDASTGGSAGAPYEFFTQGAGTGTVRFDLSRLVGSTLGLQFQLSALPGDAAFDSSVSISNVRLEALPVSVPESVWLFISGLCGLGLLQAYAAKARRTGPFARVPSLC